MKKNKVIMFLGICIIILVVACITIYFISKYKIAYSFESKEISYIKDNSDYASCVKKGITKIVISSEEETKIIEDDSEIAKFISKLNNYNGYKISFDRVPLSSRTSVILYTTDSTLTIYLSTSSISINNTHYRTTTNYLEELN